MIHFLAGLPRSGSTLLGALLNQNSKLYVTPTNDLLEMVVQARNNWTQCDGFRAQGIENMGPHIRHMLQGMMWGFYKCQLASGLSILDKCRGWPAYIELVEDILERKIKVVCPIRDLKEIVASFEVLRNKYPLTAPHGVGGEYLQQQTILGRAQVLLSPAGVIGIALRRILDAFDRGLSDRFLIVPYNQLLEGPQAICTQVFAYLGIKPGMINTDEIENHDTRRDVDVWGYPLHRIRRNGVENKTRPWQEVLPNHVADWIDTEFACMKVLAQK